ncbi:MAG TPA: HD domain-containing protein [Terracidiphilus sp.]|nr:HD domain-containing protein [Terracidiphilus sp.]
MQTFTSVDEVFGLFASGGSEAYFGEPVTQLEHALQAAWYVEQHGGDKTLVVAALLHDVGHLLHHEGEDIADRGVDTRHEEMGAEALAGHLPAAVLDPIHLHVAAKRYLCFADDHYYDELSPASKQSLALQGGPMTAAEAEAFLALPYAREAVTLRRADDAAKIPRLQVPELETYRERLESLWK